MSNAEKKNIAPIIPDLNRKEVKERQFGTPAVDFAAFCRLRGALKLWDFIVTDLNATFYKAEFTVLELLPDLRDREEHTSELQSQSNLVCRLLLEKKKKK